MSDTIKEYLSKPGLDRYDNNIKDFIRTKSIVYMTKAEYDAAIAAGTIDENLYYAVDDDGMAGSAGLAKSLIFDNAESGLAADNVQDAIVEVNNKIIVSNTEPEASTQSINDVWEKDDNGVLESWIEEVPEEGYMIPPQPEGGN